MIFTLAVRCENCLLTFTDCIFQQSLAITALFANAIWFCKCCKTLKQQKEIWAKFRVFGVQRSARNLRCE